VIATRGGAVHEFVADACTTDAYFLGEGCRWDDVRRELYWVNIYDGQFLRARADGPNVQVVECYELGGSVGVVAPYKQRGEGWIVARDRSLWHLSEAGELDRLVNLEAPGDVRVNDGAADPWGRFWVGTMAHDAAPGRGSLYRWDDANGARTVREGVAISNGLGWSPDRRTMYYVDSGPAVVYAFDVDDRGELGAQRVFAQLDAASDGSPDGLCVDAEGAIWVALWGGGSVRRYAPTGEVIARVLVDTSQPSSCAIGGANGTTLYVTTAREELSEEVLATEPLAGRLFCADVGVPGQHLDSYRPDAGA
jgi:sugar lactone lactonase YvrE